MDELPDMPPGPVTAEMLYRHAWAILEHAKRLQPEEAKAWRDDAAHIRDAADRMSDEAG